MFKKAIDGKNIMEEVNRVISRNRDDVAVTLSDKRLLTINEFSTYTSMGLGNARKIANESGSVFKAGRRFLVDRAKFDRWCDNNTSIDLS